MNNEIVMEAVQLKVRLSGPQFFSKLELGIKFEEDGKIIFNKNFSKEMTLNQINAKVIEILDPICDLNNKHEWELTYFGTSKDGKMFTFDYSKDLNMFSSATAVQPASF